MATYVGLDVHKQSSHATVMDERGQILKQEKFRNEPEEFKRFFQGIDDAEVAIEASCCWQPVYELLESEGYRVRLAHPMKTRLIAEARIKTDERDSEALAHLLRTNLLPMSYVPQREIRELRELVRLRTYLVRERAKFKHKIRSELLKRGVTFLGNPFAKRCRPALRKLGIKPINECLAVMKTLDERIKRISKKIVRKASSIEEVRLLMSIPGVSHFSALAILSEIGDISRFPDEGKLCGYAGLVPALEQSGSTRRYGHITKQGSSMLRWIVQECIWVHLRYDTHISRFFYRLAWKKGKKIAAVAAARKLLVAIYWMLKNREEFRAH